MSGDETDETPIQRLEKLNKEIVFLIQELRYGTNTGSARKALEDTKKEFEDKKQKIINEIKKQKGGKRKLKRKTMKSKSKKRTTRKH